MLSFSGCLNSIYINNFFVLFSIIKAFLNYVHIGLDFVCVWILAMEISAILHAIAFSEFTSDKSGLYLYLLGEKRPNDY